jgi:hypothetical protein
MHLKLCEGDSARDLLEQQQSKEAALLLHRFRELRQQQQLQQDKLMRQQKAQLEVLQEEQLLVQALVKSQRGAQWGDGRGQWLDIHQIWRYMNM